MLGRDGGYILGPSHWIQAGTPPGNIVAMFDTRPLLVPVLSSVRGVRGRFCITCSRYDILEYRRRAAAP